MSYPPRLLSQMIDLQENTPRIPLKLTRVGVKNLVVDLKIRGRNGTIDLMPSVELYVDLPSNKRGVHLSRDPEAIYDVLERGSSSKYYFIEDFCETIARDLLVKHSYASRAEVGLNSRYLVSRRAPGQSVVTREPCEIIGMAAAVKGEGGEIAVKRGVGAKVVGFTACPCTQTLLKTLAQDKLRKMGYSEKEVEEVLDNVTCATHTQRTTGYVLLRIPEGYHIDVEDLISILEESMSGRTHTILKRPAEASVVETGCRRAMFTEDVIREVLETLSKKYSHHPDGVEVFVQILSNESVHKHDILAERNTTLKEIRREIDSGGQH